MSSLELSLSQITLPEYSFPDRGDLSDSSSDLSSSPELVSPSMQLSAARSITEHLDLLMSQTYYPSSPSSDSETSSSSDDESREIQIYLEESTSFHANALLSPLQEEDGTFVMVDEDDEDSYSSPDELLDVEEALEESSSEGEGVMVDIERLKGELPSYEEALEGDVLIHDVVAVIVEEGVGLFDDDEDDAQPFADEDKDTLVRGASLQGFHEEQEVFVDEKRRRVSFGNECIVINPDGEAEEYAAEETVVAPVIDTTSIVFGDHQKVLVDEVVIIKSQADAVVNLDDVFISEDEVVEAEAAVVPEGEVSGESVSSNEATLIEGTAAYDGVNPFEQAIEKHPAVPVEEALPVEVDEVAEVAGAQLTGEIAFREITASEEDAVAALEASIVGEITPSPVIRTSCSDDRTNSFIIPDVRSVDEDATPKESAVISEPLKGVAATIAGFGQTMVVHTRKQVVSPEDSSLEESTIENVSVSDSVDDTEVESEDFTSTDKALTTSTDEAVEEVEEVAPPLPPKQGVPTIFIEEPAPVDQDELEIIETPVEEDEETFEELVLETGLLEVYEADDDDARTECSYMSISPDMIELDEESITSLALETVEDMLPESQDQVTVEDGPVEAESLDPVTVEGGLVEAEVVEDALVEAESLTTRDITSGSITKVLDTTTGTTMTVIDMSEQQEDEPLSDTPFVSDYAPLPTYDNYTDTEPESIASEPAKNVNLFNIFFDQDTFVDSEAEDPSKIRKETVGVQTDDSCLMPNDYSPLYYRDSMMFSTDDELSEFAERGSSKRKRHSIPLSGGLTQVRCEKNLEQLEVQTVPKPRLPGVKSDSGEFDKYELQAKYLACLEPGSVLVSHNVRSLSTTDDEIINTMEEREIFEMFNNPYDNCLSWDWRTVFSDTSSSSSTVVSSKEPAVHYVKDHNEEELVRLGDPLVPIIEQPSEYDILSTYPNDDMIDEDLDDENMGELTRRVDEFVSTMKIDLELRICPMCPMKCVIL